MSEHQEKLVKLEKALEEADSSFWANCSKDELTQLLNKFSIKISSIRAALTQKAYCHQHYYPKNNEEK